jgi:hypothetical protein
MCIGGVYVTALLEDDDAEREHAPVRGLAAVILIRRRQQARDTLKRAKRMVIDRAKAICTKQRRPSGPDARIWLGRAAHEPWIADCRRQNRTRKGGTRHE